MNTKNNARLDYLDVLRGWAAIAVCVQHILGYVYHTYNSTHPMYSSVKFIVAESVDLGRFGVILFFLISGFIIPNSLKPGAGALKKFFISRFFRLYPAYWATLLLILISVASFESSQRQYSNFDIFANATMMPKLFGINEMSGVFWTLFIELVFYGCCVILFRLKLLDKAWAVGLIAISMNLTTPVAIGLNKIFQLQLPVQFILFHLSFLFAGNLLRLAFVQKNKTAGWFACAYILLNFLTVPISSGIIFPVPAAIEKGFVMFTPEAVIYAYILAVAIFIFSIAYKSLNSRIVSGLGEISYSLYLMHMLCFAFVAKFISPETVYGFFIYIAVSSILCYMVAKLSFNLIENTAVVFGRQLVKSRGYA
ncbi:acyltransferase family protein [Ferribacterium limneticum]|uniref:acyltransferase family protein n=1 Tax=Ferribacterium limneticum TaxID=76259 RepID=UPI001CF93647|nr:acyltransferase [Ferribacterium limneticum]UCV17256.1 acyltransferase [Ferribacterium limneticum]